MTNESTVQPFAPGDVLVASTLLNNPEDDHAGDGRIIQYDRDLNEKGVLWTTGTTHLVGGLKFDPQGVLWAFDSQNFAILQIDSSGKQLANREFDQRPFSNVCFASDGSIYLGEHLAGDTIAVELGTVIPKIPGSDKYGDGHVLKYSAGGELLAEYPTKTLGGMGGFLGVTMSTLSPDEKTLYYVTETSPALMRYDLENNQQLGDLVAYPEGAREMFFGVVFTPGEHLIAARGKSMETIDSQGDTTRSYPLEGFGWATITASADAQHVYVGNFFTGEIAKVDLGSGEKVASANVGVERSLAGIAEYPL